MFALVNNTELLLGPIEFNYRLFNSVLEEELEIDARIKPSDYINVPLTITDSVKLLNVVEDKPYYDEKYEKISLVSYEVLEDNVTFHYEKGEKDLDLIKKEHRDIISAERWNRENFSYIDLNINNTDIKVSTSRENRISLISKLSSGNGPYNFKFGDTWLQITSEDIKTIIGKIDEKVQEFFDWEHSITNQINSSSSSDQIQAIDFFDPNKKINDLLFPGTQGITY